MSANGILYLVLYQRDDMRSTGTKEKPLRQKLERLLRLLQKLAIVIWREHLIRYIPNKKAGQSIKSDTSTAINNISHSVESVNGKPSLSEDLAHRLCSRRRKRELKLLRNPSRGAQNRRSLLSVAVDFDRFANPCSLLLPQAALAGVARASALGFNPHYHTK